MRPAGQCFDPGNRRRARRHLGLEGDSDGARGERLAQRHHHGQPPLSQHLVRRLPQHRAAVREPGAVHRRLGPAEQRSGVRAVLGRQYAPHRQPDVRADGAELHAAIDLRTQPETEHPGVAAGHGCGHRDREAPRADAPDQRGRGGRVQPARDLAEQVVTHLVAEGVIDLPERVDRHCREHDAVVLFEHRGQVLRRPAQVRQSCHRVGGSGPAQVAEQPSAVERDGQLGRDRLEQPEIFHVESSVGGDTVRCGEQPDKRIADDQRRRHLLGLQSRVVQACLEPAGAHIVRFPELDSETRPQPALAVGHLELQLSGVHELADVLQHRKRVGVLDVDGAEDLDKGVEVFGGPLLGGKPTVGPIGQPEYQREPEHDQDRPRVGDRSRHRQYGQANEDCRDQHFKSDRLSEVAPAGSCEAQDAEHDVKADISRGAGHEHAEQQRSPQRGCGLVERV